MSDNAIELVRETGGELSVADVQAQMAKIQDLMGKALRQGQHYGTIPGTEKPTLLKPGAEKINLLFRIGTGDLEVIRTDMERGHREITIKTPMVHIPSGKVIAYGVGSCSTMETKYRYRNQKRKCPTCNQETIIKGKEDYGGGWLCWKKKGGCGAKFADGDRNIESQIVGKIENEDIADTYNTVLKMAAKRSYVDGTIKASATSDFFTQDVEDMPGNEEAIEVEAEPSTNETTIRQAVRDATAATTPPKAPKDTADDPIAARKALEEEVVRLSHLLTADTVTSVRDQIASWREKYRGKDLNEYMDLLKGLQKELEGKVNDKGLF